VLINGLLCHIIRGFFLFFIFHQSGSRADSEPEPNFEPVLSVLTTKALAPSMKTQWYTSTNTAVGPEQRTTYVGSLGWRYGPTEMFLPPY